MDKEKAELARETAQQTEPADIESGYIVEGWTEDKINSTRKRASYIKGVHGLLLFFVLITPIAGFSLCTFNMYMVMKFPVQFLIDCIMDRYTHIGLDWRIPLINRTWTIVPKLWPADSAISEIVAGTDSWPFQRDITAAWLRRLRSGERPYLPGVEATWVWTAVGMVPLMIFLKMFCDWWDGNLDFGWIGKWLAGLI